MQLKIETEIRTNIISNMQYDRLQNKIYLLTRKTANKTSKWQYYIQKYEEKSLQKQNQIYIYSSYNDQKHFFTVGKNTIAIGTRDFVYLLAKSSLKISRKLEIRLQRINDIKFSANQRFLGLVGDGIIIWQTNDYSQIMLTSINLDASWKFIEFTKMNNILVIASLNQIYHYQYVSIINSFSLLNSTRIQKQTSYITSLQASPINDDQLLLGRLQSDPNYFYLSTGQFIKKTDKSQPNSLNNIKVADYFPDGMGFISGDLKGVAIWKENGDLIYFKNIIIGSIKVSNNGLFIYNYLWEALRKVQIIVQCPQSLSQTRSICNCPSSQIWSPSSSSCKNLLCDNRQNNRCVCKQGYNFDPVSAKCLINCSKINRAFRNSKSQNMCQCQYPYKWDIQSESCIYSCQIFAYAITQKSLDKIQCRCNFDLQWNTISNKCQCVDQYSQFDQTQTSCSCKAGYFLNQNTNLCQINCIQISNVDQQNPQLNPQECRCQNQFSFIQNSFGQIGCFRNCDNLQNTVSQYRGNTQQCRCVENYFWSGNSCQVNCTQATQLGQFNSDGSCKCPINYLWNPSIAQCIKDCKQIDFALTQGSTNKQCQCKKSFLWNTQSQICEIQCKQIDDATQFKINSKQCECRQGFNWNKTSYKCDVNCSNIDDAYRQISENQCKCRNGKVYDAQKAICIDQDSALIFGDIWITLGIIAGGIIVLVLILSIIRCLIIKCRDKKREKIQTEKRQRNQKNQRDYVWKFNNNRNRYEDMMSDERFSQKQYRGGST